MISFVISLNLWSTNAWVSLNENVIVSNRIWLSESKRPLPCTMIKKAWISMTGDDVWRGITISWSVIVRQMMNLSSLALTVGEKGKRKRWRMWWTVPTGRRRLNSRPPTHSQLTRWSMIQPLMRNISKCLALHRQHRSTTARRQMKRDRQRKIVSMIPDLGTIWKIHTGLHIIVFHFAVGIRTSRFNVLPLFERIVSWENNSTKTFKYSFE